MPKEEKHFWAQIRLVVVVGSVVVVRVVRVVAARIDRGGCAGAGRHGVVWKSVFLSVCRQCLLGVCT